MMWGYGWDMGWMWLLGILTLAVIVLVVLLAVRLFGGGASRPRANPTSSEARDSARRILDERFARGDLTADQYREQVRILSED